MAVTFVQQSTRTWFALAADVKPTNAHTGDRLLTTDTQAWYVYTGSAWVAETTDDTVSASGTGINVAATAVDAGAEAATDEAIAAAAAGTRLMGFSARETAGAVATFSLHNGTGNADPALFTVSLAANESRSEWFGPEGIAAAGGIWLQRLTGTTQVIGHYKVVP